MVKLSLRRSVLLWLSVGIGLLLLVTSLNEQNNSSHLRGTAVLKRRWWCDDVWLSEISIFQNHRKNGKTLSFGLSGNTYYHQGTKDKQGKMIVKRLKPDSVLKALLPRKKLSQAAIRSMMLISKIENRYLISTLIILNLVSKRLRTWVQQMHTMLK